MINFILGFIFGVLATIVVSCCAIASTVHVVKIPIRGDKDDNDESE